MSVTFRIVGHVFPGHCQIATYRREYVRFLAELASEPDGFRELFARIKAAELSTVSDEPAEINFSNKNAAAVLCNLGLPSELQGDIGPEELIKLIRSRRPSEMDERETVTSQESTQIGTTSEEIDERIERLQKLAETALEVGGRIEWL